ncbi:membrane protein insertion efficiency factor YidD [Alloacidobacterium dinghuense]|nr:membrane protein insertion efficiency factor YidD [Alloacidobacterium dinghuense]
MNKERGTCVLLMGPLHTFYKLFVSPVLHAGAGMAGGACRFQPTCSEYAAIAVHEHGWLRGGWMSLKRMSRCHPGGKGGFDPVPQKCPFMQSSKAPVTMKEAHISHESRS